MLRAKFYRLHGPCQLRIEQIGPDLWHGSVYELRPFPNWERFTCLSEECSRRCAIVTVQNRLRERREGEPELEGDWFNDSDRSDEEWRVEIAALNFPGYLNRDGMERFTGLPAF
jgi:hypothetical protein